MSLLTRLVGAGGTTPSSGLAAEIERALGRLPTARAELIAAFAGLLVRIAYADHEISEAERTTLRELVGRRTGLAAAEAETVVGVATHHATALAGINYAALTRTLNATATPTEKEQLVDCLYAIACAGSTISIAEDDEIRAVAHALLLSHRQFIAIRSRHREQLDLLRGVRPPTG